MAQDPRTFAFGTRPLAALASPREAIRQFTPNWFAATMGTGVLAFALGQWPVAAPELASLGELLWLANTGVFMVFCAMYATRWLLYFDEARRIFEHATMSMFLGALPMALATIINGLLRFGLPRWGAAAVLPLAEALWWLDVAMALACGVAIPLLMFTRQRHHLEQMTGVWLLPVVAAEVAATTGGLLAPHLVDPAARFTVLVTSYVLWAYSVPVALSLLVVLLLRLALHRLPQAGMAASTWLALGPVGTAALGMLVLGAEAPAILAAHGLPGLGTAAAGIGVIAGLLFWGLGLWWMALAVLITARQLRHGLPFNLGWWGFTFPLGVYALATLKLGSALQLAFFAHLGVALVALLAAVWLIVAARTLAGGYRGNLFVSPCLPPADPAGRA